jgi:EAL domain-containing protein (putative c-di-GMP-specific phosphodiesterase class I)
MADAISPDLADATSEEAMLYERIRSFERARPGAIAVHFHLSKLKEHNRQPHFVRIAARAFDSLITSHDAGLYVLANSDLVLVGRDLRVGAVDPVVIKLRALFSNDPLTSGESDDPAAVFATWYDLSDLNDFTRFLGLAKKLAAKAEQLHLAGSANPLRPEATRGATLAPGNLRGITERLQMLSINELIRIQTAFDVASSRILFREHFIAMAELRRRIAQDVNLFGSPWLFQYLTESVDKRMLIALAAGSLAAIKDPISVNLNMASVSSREFRHFHDGAAPFARKIIIEMQMIDVFSDMNTFFQTRDWLQKEGYRVLIDGLSPLSLQFFDPSLLETDFVKINWSADLDSEVGSRSLAHIRETVARTGPDKIILGRVEVEKSLKWGLTLGIHQFQGYFVDRLFKAMAQKQII